MSLRHLLVTLCLLPVMADAQSKAPLLDNTESDWQAVIVLDAGPGQVEIRSREQALAVTLAQLAKQENGLCEFLKKHPNSGHVPEAQLRLARLLAVRSDINGNPPEFDAAMRLLDEGRKAAPADRVADFDFARISLLMQRIGTPTDQDREMLTAQMLVFQKSYPTDRRVPALMAEIATLYDAQPRRKSELLTEAHGLTTDPKLRARIEDDLKRISFLGRQVGIQGTTLGGIPFDIAKLRGKVTLVFFFAAWSEPSLVTLDQVEKLRKTFAADSVEIVGVSLDTGREPLEALLMSRKITWPVLYDGKGWKSPLVRGLGLNAIPTLWVLDKKGNLRTLNAKADGEATARALLKEN